MNHNNVLRIYSLELSSKDKINDKLFFPILMNALVKSVLDRVNNLDVSKLGK